MLCEFCKTKLDQVDAHTINDPELPGTYILCAACDEHTMNLLGAIAALRSQLRRLTLE